ncbi:MAG: hypothetical protein GXP06_00735 [Alphaproteobacteria bacterium]|nr:hypothetical protein [Alphaproteobacteria bacterium]
MRLKFILAGAACASLITTAATAHPGSEILTAGGVKERAAMTQGVSFEEVNGVHLFRGSKAASKASRPAALTQNRTIRIEIAAPRFVWRSFRGLRTQGFYSGKAYPSRRYRHGFYSGR